MTSSAIPASNMPSALPYRRLSGDRNQCPSCGLFFNSVRAFDVHRIGRYGLPHGHPEGRRCRTEAEMLAKGMAVNGYGFWVRAVMPRERIPVKV